MSQIKSIMTPSLPIRPSSHFILRSWIKVHKTVHYPLNSLIYFCLVFGQIFVIVVQSPSCLWLFATPWTAACQASLSLTVSRGLPRFTSIASVMPSSHLILWCSLLLLPSIFLRIWDFPMSQLLASDDQNAGASTSASVLPTSIQIVLLQPKAHWAVGHFLCVNKPVIQEVGWCILCMNISERRRRDKLRGALTYICYHM